MSIGRTNHTLFAAAPAAPSEELVNLFLKAIEWAFEEGCRSSGSHLMKKAREFAALAAAPMYRCPVVVTGQSHELKARREFFEAVVNGTKPFEARYNDRNFQVGDVVRLREWEDDAYTGRQCSRVVTFVLTSPEFCKDGWAILGLHLPEIKRCTRCGRYEDGTRECPSGDKQCPIPLAEMSLAQLDQTSAQFVLKTLRDCRLRLEADGSRQSWIDPAINMLTEQVIKGPRHYDELPGGMNEQCEQAKGGV